MTSRLRTSATNAGDEEDGITDEAHGHDAWNGRCQKQLEQVDDRDIDRIAAIIQSMTPKNEPTRRSLMDRAALGSPKAPAFRVSEVNNLLTRFVDAQKMMKQMGKGGGLPGMPGWVAARSRVGGKNRPVQEGQERAAAEIQRSARRKRGCRCLRRGATPGSGLMVQVRTKA